MKKHSKEALSPIELFGSIDENFYQLGVKDREYGKFVHSNVNGMLKTPYIPLNKLIERVGHEVISSTLLKDKNRYPHLKAYAEGLGVPTPELFYTMLIPELVSAMTKWAPGAVAGNLGCSSFFMRNQNKSLVHGRILDFPLQGSYDLHERSIVYHLTGMPKTIGFNTVGIPYPSITAMTENGMTIALHQKFTNVFEKSGDSIFEIIFDLIKNATDKKSAIEFLKSKTSLTTWCLYIGFPNGEILAYDIMGKDSFYNEFEINENEIKYFCNHLEDKNLNQENYLPLGFSDYNKMREAKAEAKIKDFLKKNQNTDQELLKMMTTPFQHQTKTLYQMDTITPTSILAVTMNPCEDAIYYINSVAPKIYQNNIVKIEAATNSPKLKIIEDKKYKNQNEEYHKGLHALILAQLAFDNKDSNEIYHHLQFAIDHLENYNDQVIAKFYFLIAQYIYETHTKTLSHILQEFQDIKLHLSGYLYEQCLLFIFRLEYILRLSITVEMEQITNKKLRDILQLEMKIPRNVFHITNRFLIVPRIDILDIIYVYTY